MIQSLQENQFQQSLKVKKEAEGFSGLLSHFQKNKSQQQQEQITKEFNQETEKQMEMSSELQQLFSIMDQKHNIQIVSKNKEKNGQSNANQDQNYTEIIQEELIPSILFESGNKAYVEIQNSNYNEAIKLLRRSESIINSFLMRQGTIEIELILFNLMNLGICLYRVGFLEEALIRFENCLISIKHPSLNKKKTNNISLSSINQTLNEEALDELPRKMKFNKIRIQLHLQCCILLSEMVKHEEGLIHGQLAAHQSFKGILNCIHICYVNIIQDRQKNTQKKFGLINNQMNYSLGINSQNNISTTHNDSKLQDPVIWQRKSIYTSEMNNDQEFSSNFYFTKMAKTSNEFTMASVLTQEQVNHSKKMLGVLEKVHELANQMKREHKNKKEMKIEILKNLCKDIELPQPDMQSIYTKDNKFQLANCNILGILQIQPYSFESLKEELNIQDQISYDNILWKISMFGISLYCNSTECRFLEEKNMVSYLNTISILDSELWLAKSLEIVFVFLKHDYPFVSQILSVYQRFHDLTRQIIPEEQDLQESYQVLKPLKGNSSKLNFYIIRIPVYQKQTQEQVEQKHNLQEKESLNQRKNNNNIEKLIQKKNQNSVLKPQLKNIVFSYDDIPDKKHFSKTPSEVTVYPKKAEYTPNSQKKLLKTPLEKIYQNFSKKAITQIQFPKPDSLQQFPTRSLHQKNNNSLKRLDNRSSEKPASQNFILTDQNFKQQQNSYQQYSENNSINNINVLQKIYKNKSFENLRKRLPAQKNNKMLAKIDLDIKNLNNLKILNAQFKNNIQLYYKEGSRNSISQAQHMNSSAKNDQKFIIKNKKLVKTRAETSETRKRNLFKNQNKGNVKELFVKSMIGRKIQTQMISNTNIGEL